ncbi:hypothetical protein SpiGrapes_2014 [Sphaerochaeta pleomorpha str. Grapes]|uniref:DUF362 domain-containing protein n=1 Tax=Sphaerochaeta pleomorpha (strain ATCC BAA-1885 / DSM 22778 / Grapes) TaxID=158190 RepID=G8QQF6_SPHPG|nr:DUF362 domain-containing protein [Sphaerochaeta pleomorpha]AEV29801.1 hypothetical protein SpiGrapes_2014 [Sphaerochaeta pleomorpha str. Grapes]
MDKNDIILTYGSDPVAMTRALLEAIDIESLILDKNSSIALKPNLVVAATAESGATTHPSIVREIISFLQERGYSRIKIVESAWVGDSTKEGFRVNGYEAISKTFKVPLVDVKDDDYEKLTSNGITMEVSKTILDTDFLISLPVLKGHCQTAMTCALKNMKGCLSDRSKRMFHNLGLHKPIAALNAIRCADLVIVDSLNGDLDFEEGGNPVRTDRMFAARDSVLCDSFGSQLLGFELEDIPYIQLAESMGVGFTDLSKARVIQLNEPTNDKVAHPSGEVANLARYTLPKNACSACYGNLIHALKRLDEVDRLGNLETKICIGQGYRGETDKTRIGVGVCTRGLGKSLGGCPPKAIDMIQFMKEL